jgi:hypothetical protein
VKTNPLWRGMFAGLLASAMLGLLFFISTGEPGRDLHGVAHWFGLDSSASGSVVGLILLLILGALLGLLFGALQGRNEASLPRMLLFGLGIGLLLWLIGPVVIGTFIGHAAGFTLGSFLLYFVPALLFGVLLGAIYFQIAPRSTA